MTHNFTTGTKNFFIAQAIGWGIFGLSNIILQVFIGLSPELVTANTSSAIIAGILVTTAYRFTIRRWNWQKWKLPHLLGFIFSAVLAKAFLWMAVTELIFKFYEPKFELDISGYLSNLITAGLLFTIWNLIYFFFKYFVKYQQSEVEKWKLTAEVKEAQLGTLRSQIRPHFVFNTLNNIKALVLEDPQRSREMLINFSDLLRYSLQHDEREMMPLENEIDLTRQYLELMSIQYEDRMKWKIETDPDSLSCVLPPMLLHLLVENAVKHGIAPSATAGEVVVEAKKLDGELHLQVRNTGTLESRSDVEGRLGTGLKNIRERLSIFYGKDAKFELKEKPPFVVAKLIIPKSRQVSDTSDQS